MNSFDLFNCLTRQSSVRSFTLAILFCLVSSGSAFWGATLWGQDGTGEENQVSYPKALTVSGDQIFVVDLDLPGVWEINAGKTLFSKGSNRLRKAMNRPHCVTSHPSGGILVGDSATREVYWIEKQGAEPKPLTNGYIGIPMALAVAPDGKTLYVGDAEKRATFRLPIVGGECELVARVNARGFAFDSDGKLLAITPDAEAIQRIDTSSGDVEVLVGKSEEGDLWHRDNSLVASDIDSPRYTPRQHRSVDLRARSTMRATARARRGCEQQIFVFLFESRHRVLARRPEIGGGRAVDSAR